MNNTESHKKSGESQASQPPIVPRRVTWHTAMLKATVWAERKGHWQEAIITARGSKNAGVQFCDTKKSDDRKYGELYHRNPRHNGADKPAETAAAE